MNDQMGPYAKKLLLARMAVLTVPEGGGIADGLKFFADADHRHKIVAEAIEWTKQAIAVMKTAPDNPYGDDDEAIAKAILDQADEKKRRG
jgi:hypothetical protein